MAKTRSWSVKGIDGETRDLARDAARASGMTIGAWIDQAILEAKHGELPADTPPKITTPAEITAPAEMTRPDLPPSPTPAASPADPVTEPPSNPVTEPPAEPEIEPGTDSPAGSPAAALPDSVSAAPASVEETENEVTAPTHEIAAPRELVAGKLAADPQPLAPPPVRAASVRYAILGIVFAALLGGGGWLFVELSSPDQTPVPQKTADGAPAVEAPPPPPAATTAPVAPTSPGTDGPDAVGLPAGLPEAIRTAISEARAGDPKSQYNVGMFYLSGRLGDKNPTEAAKWFKRAAEQGIPNAQFNLGVLYQRGEGLTQNDRLAFFWFQSAAEQNFAQAQHNLATAYAKGKGIAQNYPKAAEWFARSAEAGLSQSQYSLGALHERGLITGRPDRAKARHWYERALAQGDTRASVRLAVLDVPPETAIGRAEIRQIQSLLSRMNFNPGPADGQMGRRTADAIRLYQKFAGMDEDGVPSRELLEDLRVVAETMSKDG